ncbi:NEDD4 binding protein 2-like 1 [Seminavis robusta]|uniref:NEDD4 binding protein 2-like 1 n=1 Tax=Seminavis robusta TaxID=568900 RepID=A0A9N8DPF7_9STRA|nr:NEDD4 binding protein 2-like 1 [Seminavis robusta]|eukprot:Sro261_g101720.1 NEDD4 binding protein 2-like 1 (1153) ;mRNA; r:31560-35018
METFENEDRGFQLWLSEFLASHESFRNNAILQDFVCRFFIRTHQFHKDHGDQLLYCHGKHRTLVSLSQAADRLGKQSQFARWYDFVRLGPNARQSGPVLVDGDKRRFEALSIKIQASRNKSKFGLTDDTGYLFPCLQQNIPRACFVVFDHLRGSAFIIHGNKKFAGQGDEGVEEGTTTSHDASSAVDLHAPPAKCFPGTEKLKPTHYIFTWKANGKNAGVYGYTDPVSKELWLFVNSKGVCECAGLLSDVMSHDHSKKTTFSQLSLVDTGQFPPHIFECFREIWKDGINQDLVLSLWSRGYLLLFEFNDNKHIVLEYGKDGRPVDHLAFIGMVQLPELGSIDTEHSGLVFKVDQEFTFDLWRGAMQAPAQTCKPTLLVKVGHLEMATQALMKGRFFYKDAPKGAWFDPPHQNHQCLAGEGAVCYEMAQDETKGDPVIRQLFKAKTASYITHRQFREFLRRTRNGDDAHLTTFKTLHQRALKFCRQKFGDLAAQPYPDPKEFCHGQKPSDVVAAAALFYTHFAMWLQERAIQMDSTAAALVDMMSKDILLPAESDAGRDYLKTAKMLGLLEDDVLRDTTDGPFVVARCGVAFQLAEFMAVHGLDDSLVFADPVEMVKRLEKENFVWENIPTGFHGEIVVGFNHVFPGGETPKMTKEAKKANKKGKKKKEDILGPIRKKFSNFLGSNPRVKVVLGKRDDQPDMIILETPDSGILISKTTHSEFNAELMALPCLVAEKGAEDYLDVKSHRLGLDAAVQQAETSLRQAFPTLQDLFDAQSPIDLQFGDVTGRLVPMVHSSTSPSKVLILRGVSGVGKSTVAKACQRLWRDTGQEPVASAPVVEADDYFGATCPYHPDLISAAHEDAQNRARGALDDSNVRCLVVSNTSTTAREYAPYLRMAVAKGASVTILTLDTATPLGFLQNLHDVDHKKVEKMARNLRSAENNPEGKTLDEIFKIADEQSANDRFHSDAALAWTVLDTESVTAVREIYVGFLQHAKEQGIMIPTNVVRPPNPHSTLVFVRRSSCVEDMKRMASLWSRHGSVQELTLGEVKYSTRIVDNKQKVLMSVAVAVTSFSPDLVERDSPHITIAYDADNASAADSNKLWQTDFKWPDDASVGCWGFQPSRAILKGTVEAGALKGDGIVHQMPDWLKKKQ